MSAYDVTPNSRRIRSGSELFIYFIELSHSFALGNNLALHVKLYD